MFHLLLFLWAMVALIIAGYYERQINLHKTHSLTTVLGSGDMFDKIAPYYDKANTWLSLGWHHNWKDVMVRDLDVYSNDLILDIATGTGDIAIKIARVMKERGKLLGSKPTIVAVDPSKEMLRIAQEKINADKKEIFHGFITLKQGFGDALQKVLETPDPYAAGNDEESHLFDKVCISFGIRNFRDKLQVLKEIRIVTKKNNPNGKLSILDFSTPSSTGVLKWIAPLVNLFIHYAVPMLGTVATGGQWPAYAHLRDTIYQSPSPAEFTDLMSSAGFAHCKHKDIFLGTVYLYTCSTYSPKTPPKNDKCVFGANGECETEIEATDRPIVAKVKSGKDMLEEDFSI